jgi:hypothetical protein
MPYFSFKRKKLFKMVTLTFRVGDQILFIFYLKNHMTFFLDLQSKLFGNLLKIFLISCLKFFWNPKLIILGMTISTLFKYVFVLFLRSC